MEKIKTKIQIGKKYKNRDGVIMTVIDEKPIESNYRERFYVVDETKNRYYYPEYVDGYAVNDFGGFGSCPNSRDLVEEVSCIGDFMASACQLVKDLAEWSRKYPRERVYNMSKMSMDDELVKLEERAKELAQHLP